MARHYRAIEPSPGALPLRAIHDLSGLIKYAGREPWKTRLEECLEEHFGPAPDELDVDFDELLDIVGPHWEGPLWGCAFEDLIGREFDGENLADDYLKRRGWNEKASVKAYIKALRQTPMSLYEVSDIVLGKSMRLRDLLQDGEPVTVEERSASSSLHNWDRIATRLIVGRGGAVISGALLAFSPDGSEQLIDGFTKIGAKPDPDFDFDVTDRAVLLRHSAPVITSTWLLDAAGVMGPPMPNLVNSDGDDILFHRLVFPLPKGVTQKQIAARFQTLPTLSPASAKFWNWLEDKRVKSRRSVQPGGQVLASTMDDGSTILGNAELAGRFLTIEINSAERAQRARDFFIPLLGDLVQAPLTEIRTVAQMMAEQRQERDEAAEPEIPAAEMQRIVRDMMDRQYRQVLDEPVPALGDKTPRQAVTTKAGRTQVVEWLKYLENGTAKSGNEQMAGYSFAWMWEELGVANLRH
ncbi:DUF2384 domain-containing protein [Novosphingobium profundi]|nr:DUF2384 domain-containing protein [Novosphingobium profundi]